MKALRRRNAPLRTLALAAAVLIAWAAGPRTVPVEAQEPASDAPAMSPLLALSADEIAALPASALRADASNPRAWRGLATPDAIHKTPDVLPGLTLLLRADGTGVEALLAAAPGADTTAFQLVVPGATAFETSGAGHAIVRAPGGDLILLRPGLHQETATGRAAVAGAWQDQGEGRIGLQVGDLDPASGLSIGFRLLGPDARVDRNRDGRVTLDELTPEVVGAVEGGGPTVTATKNDTLATDVDLDGLADPGDTLRYDIVVGATGTAATGVQLADPLDPNLTLVPGSVNVSPLARDDTYEAIGNVTLSVSSPAAGLFANDTEFLGDTFVLTSPAPGVPTPTPGGGTVTVQADGTFTYTTAAGTTATSDTFNYTITDGGGLTGSGTVTFTIAGLVWFVDRDAAPGGTGTQASPFDALADVNGAGGAGDPDAPNHIIYLYDRSAPVDYTGGLELEAGQRLVGSGAALVVGTTTVLPAGTPPTVVNTTGDALQLATGVQVEGLVVQAANDSALAGTGALGTVVVTGVSLALSGNGAGLDLATHTGSVSFASGSITGGGTGTALSVQGGTGSVTLATSSINRSAGRLVDVQGKTGGSVTLGTVTGTGAATDAIVLANNSGTTLSFPSGFNVTTTSGRGLLANNTGSISIGGTTSTVNATGQASLEILDTTINGTATFVSLSSTSSLGPGLRLESGVGGALVVTNGVTVTNPGDVGIGIQFTTLSVTVGGPGTQISGAVDDVSLVVSGSIGDMSFGATTITGGNDGIRLLNNVGGTRNFASLNISSNAGVGVLHNNGGAVFVTGNATLTPGGTGIDIQNSGASVVFSGLTTIDKAATAGLGLNLVNNTSGPAFGTLNVTTSNGAGLAIANSPFGTTAGTIGATGAPAISSTGGAFVATFTSVSSTNSPTQGLNLDASSGTLSIAGGSITGATGTSVLATGTLGNTTYGGSVTKANAGKIVVVSGPGGGSLNLSGNLNCSAPCTGLDVLSRDGGTITFSGLSKVLSTGANQAVTLTANPGASVLFTNGGLDIDTTSGTGFGATGGGTVTVQGAVNTINATTGVALNVSATTIGAAGTAPEGGLRFQTISSGGSGNVGISLVTTGTAGGLTVTGTGSAASGGTIAGKTGVDGSTTAGIGIYLDTTSNVSLSRMQLNDFSNFAIRGLAVTNFTLADSTISGTNGNNGGVDEGAVVFGTLPPATTNGLLGTAAITNSVISGGVEDNVRIVNHSGTLTQLTVSGSTIRDTASVSPGNEGFLLQAEGTASVTADFVGNSFLRNRANGLHVIQQGTGNVNVEVGQVATPGSGGTFDDNNIGVNVNTNSAGDLTFALRSATIDGLNVAPGTGGSASPVNLNVGTLSTAASVLSATIEGVTATNSNSTTGPGMRLIANGAGVLTALVQNNTISQVANRGIEVLTRDGSATINATLLNNSVTLNNALSGDAIRADSGATATDNGTVCADIRQNTATTTAVGLFGIRVRQRFLTTYRIEGYAGAAADDTAVQTFLSTNNNGATTSADHAASGSAGFLGSAGCPVP